MKYTAHPVHFSRLMSGEGPKDSWPPVTVLEQPIIYKTTAVLGRTERTVELTNYSRSTSR